MKQRIKLVRWLQHSLKNHHVYTRFPFYAITVILEDRFLAILQQTEKLLAYLLGGVFFLTGKVII